jgi:microcystin-dependent protein
MATTYTSRLRLPQQGVNDNPDLWGIILNDTMGLVDTAVAGITAVAMPDANITLSTANGAPDQARSAILAFSGTLTAPRFVDLPAGISKVYIVSNMCTNSLTFRVGAGPNVALVPAFRRQMIFTDGAGVYEANTYAEFFNVASLGVGYLDAVTLLQGGSPVWSPGDIKPTMATAVPTGWLAANGQAVSRTTFAALFAAIGTSFGAGDGSTTFNVPDLRGRVLAGLDAGAGRLSAATALGWAGGFQSHTLVVGEMPNHAHSATADAQGNHQHFGNTNGAGAHNHSLTFPKGNNFSLQYGSAGGPIGPESGVTDGVGDHTHGFATDFSGTHSHNITVAANGGGGAHNNVQPTMATNWLIKT